jgi:hypothetical protein
MAGHSPEGEAAATHSTSVWCRIERILFLIISHFDELKRPNVAT